PVFPGLPPLDYSELRRDERLAVHPIGVTTDLAERADLEVIDSSHGQATDGGLLGTGNRNYRPRTEYTTCTFECVAHVERQDARLTCGFHSGFAAVISAINRVELRLSQSSQLRIHLDHDDALLVFRLDGFLTAIFSVNNQRRER